MIARALRSGKRPAVARRRPRRALDVHQCRPAPIAIYCVASAGISRSRLNMETTMKLPQIGRLGALAAGLALVAGIGTAASPADAQVRIGINLFGPGYYVPYYYRGYPARPYGYGPYPYGPYYAPYSYGPYYRHYQYPYYVPYYERHQFYR
jgi:hypothetical protein